MEKRFIGINLIADQSAYTWGLIHQGQMLITFINIDRGYKYASTKYIQYRDP